MLKPSKKSLVIAVTFLLIGIIGTSVVWVYAQPTTTFTLSQGIYPHAVSFTMFPIGASFYVKDSYGGIAYSGSNGTEVFEDAEATMTSGGTVFFASGSYPTITVTQDNIDLKGNGYPSQIDSIEVNDGVENLTVSNIVVNGFLVTEETTTLRDIIIQPPNASMPRIVGGMVVELDDGRLLCAYRGNYDVMATQTDFEWWQKYSLDGGLTWEAGYPIETSGSYGVAPLTLLRSGSKIFCFHYHFTTVWTDAKVYVRMSDDNGETWGSDTLIDISQAYHVGSFSAIKMQSGRLIYPTNWADGVNFFRSGCVYSINDGVSWVVGGTVPDINASVSYGLDEPAIAELSNGSLLMHIRTSGIGATNLRHFRSLSDDGGVTWSTPTAIPELFSYDTTPALSRLSFSPSVLMAMWINRTSGGTFDRRPLMYALSYDEGSTWVNLKVLDDLGGDGVNGKNANNLQAPIRLSNDKILTVYWRYGKYDFDTPLYRDFAVSRMFDLAWIQVPQTSVEYLPYNAW